MRARNNEARVLEVERKSLLSYGEKAEIVRRHSLGDSITDLVIRFNVCRTTVKSIINISTYYLLAYWTPLSEWCTSPVANIYATSISSLKGH